MTTKYAVWTALHTPASTFAVATAMSLDYQLVANAVRDLRKTKHVEFVEWRNRQAIYKAVGEAQAGGARHVGAQQQARRQDDDAARTALGPWKAG